MELNEKCIKCMGPARLGASVCNHEDCPVKASVARGNKPFLPIAMCADYTMPERDPHEPILYVIFDLDGVLCKFSEARQEMYHNHDFDGVNGSGCSEPMIGSVVQLSRSLGLMGVETFIFTSRDAYFMADTVVQLNDGGVRFRALLMRGSRDNKSSSIQLKNEMYDVVKEMFPSWKCAMAIDDRPDIIEFYNSLGLNGVLFSESNIKE